MSVPSSGASSHPRPLGAGRPGSGYFSASPTGIFFSFFSLFNVYLFLRERERERQSVSGGGTEGEGDTESEAGSRLRTVSTEPDTGLEPTNREIMT